MVAGIASFVTMGLTAGLVVGSHSSRGTTAATRSAARNAPAALAADFARLQARLHASVGIVISAVGGKPTPIAMGDWRTGPAWSTIKVPLVIAGLQEKRPPRITTAMDAAITRSDNAAAESIWAGLGDPVTAAHKVEAVLRSAGDPTIVQSQKVRPEFTAFGQTDWPLTEQVSFTSAAYCDHANAPVFDLMQRIQPDQRWGIGALASSRFKGGWGPSRTGEYLVRQIGVMTAPRGLIAVALAAQPASGNFDEGTADLTEMARWLDTHIADLPAGQCAR